jgi:hypothetical protein
VAFLLVCVPAQAGPVYPRWDPAVPGSTAPQDAAAGRSVLQAALDALLTGG